MRSLQQHGLVDLAVPTLLRHVCQQSLASGDGRFFAFTRLLGVSLTPTSTECAVLVDLDPARDDDEGGQRMQQLQAARMVATGAMLNAEGLKRLVEEHQVKHGFIHANAATCHVQPCCPALMSCSALRTTPLRPVCELMHADVPHVTITVPLASCMSPPYRAPWHALPARLRVPANISIPNCRCHRLEYRYRYLSERCCMHADGCISPCPAALPSTCRPSLAHACLNMFA